MEAWTRAFVTLLATMNVIPILPIIVSMVEQQEPQDRRMITRRALGAGVLVAVGITLLGQVLFGALGITVADLRISGGLILLVFAIHDLLFSTAQRKTGATIGKATHDDVGIVPLGIPLIVGPAGLTVLLVTADAQGLVTTLTALVAVALFNLVVLELAPRVLQRVGSQITRAIGKVMSLFLAAIAVSMIRAGIL